MPYLYKKYFSLTNTLQCRIFILLLFLTCVISNISYATDRIVCSGCGYSTIQSAINAASNGDVILINVNGTITESVSGGILVNKNLTIRGLGMNTTVIQAHATKGSAENRVFYVPSGTVVFENLTIKNGKQLNAIYMNGAGSGVLVEGATTNVSFNNVNIKDNTAGVGGSAGGGLAIANDGAVVNLNNSIIEGNTAGAGSAGGMYLANGTCYAKNTIFRNNDAFSGGGASLGGTVTAIFSYCTFSGNQATNSGTSGAISWGSALPKFYNCTFNDNKSTNLGGATRCGGGTFSNCTFFGNTAVKGAAINRGTASASNPLYIINCTIANNKASSTIADGTGAGILNSSTSAQIYMVNTVVVNNTFEAPSSNGSDVFMPDGSTLVTNDNNYVGSSMFTMNPKTFAKTSGANLSTSLSDNGGLTQTVAVNSGSVLINNGVSSHTNTNIVIPSKDQRNSIRSGATDIGAYETGATESLSITYTALANTGVTSNRTLSATITDNISGIPTSGSLMPRIHYKKNTATSWTSTQGVAGTSNAWTFTIDNSLIGGVSASDEISYFVVAQDNSAGSYARSLPAGVITADVNYIGSAPATVNKYNITASVVVPTLSTSSASSVTSAIAVLGGNVTANGGGALTERGIVYSTSTNPEIGGTGVTKVQITGTATGIYSQSISGLTAGTTYYVKAYAINSAGTAYGSQTSFKTSPSIAGQTGVISLGASSNIVNKTDFGAKFNDGEGGTTDMLGAEYEIFFADASATVEGLVRYFNNTNTDAFDGRTGFFYPNGQDDDVANPPYQAVIQTANGAEFNFKGIYILNYSGLDASKNSVQIVGYKDNVTTGSVNVTIPSSGQWGLNLTQSNGLTASIFQNVDKVLIRTAAGSEAPHDFWYSFNDISVGDAITISTPTVTTSSVSSFSTTSATLGGEITSDGGSTITSRGIVYSTSANPEIGGADVTKVQISGTTTGTFSQSITGLTEGAPYYVRAYAINSVGTSYGSNKTFSTLRSTSLSGISLSEGTLSPAFSASTTSYTVSVPNSVSSVTVSASMPNGMVTIDDTSNSKSISLAVGETTVTVYLSYNSGYTGSVSQYTVKITRLAPADTQGPTVTGFYPPAGFPITDPSLTQLTINFDEKVQKGTGTITLFNATDDTDQSVKVSSADVVISNSSVTIKGIALLPTKSYYVKVPVTAFKDLANNAYAGVENSTSWSFTTIAVAPTLSTSAATDVTNISATLAGDISSNGGASITERGVVYSTTSTPTLGTTGAVKVAASGTSTGAFTAAVSGLNSNSTYYYQAYAVNSKGTSYGGNKSFTTLNTASITSIVRSNTNPTKATEVNYTVTFSASVTGVDASDFTLTKGGSATGVIGTPTGTGTTWTIPVSSVSGNGTLRLDFTSTTGVTPNTSATYTSGEAYTIDTTKPVAPVNFVATGKDLSVNLNWDANSESDIAGYKIYWGVSANDMNPPSSVLTSRTASELSYTHTGLTNKTPYWYAIIAVDAAGNESAFSHSMTWVKADQTIVFKSLTPATYGDSQLELAASATSTLAVSYTSDNDDVATISGKMVTIKAPGTVKITAKQTGNDAYHPAPNVVQTLTVKPKLLTITAKDKTKTYGETVSFNGSEYQQSGLINSDEVSSVTLNSSGTVSTAAANATGYDIEVSNAAGSGLSNYDIVYVKGKLKVSQKAITATAAPITKIYDGNNSATIKFDGLTSTHGVIGSDEVTVAYTSAVYNDKNAGSSKSVSITGLTLSGAAKDNYTLNPFNASGNIIKKSLTVTANNQTKAYDATDHSGGNGVEYSGFAGTDNSTAVNGTASYSGTSQSAKNVGEYVITPSGLSSDNYELSYVNGILTIEKKSLTVTPKNQDKTYDATAYSGGNGIEYTGFAGSEDAAVLGGTLVYTGDSQGAVDAGTYTISASGLTSDNYEFLYKKGILTIDKKTLVVTAKDQSKTYDAADYSGGNGVTYAGFAGTDDASVLSGTVSYSGTSQGAKNAGEYTLIPSGLSVTNYQLSYIAGKLTINKKNLTVTAENKSKSYGDANPTLTVTYSGLVNGETTLNPAPTVTTTASELSGVGTYDITATGTAANYDVSFEKGSLTVNQKALTIKVNNQSKTYGDANPALTLTYTGLVNNETALNPSPNVTTTATELSGIGIYDITATGTAANYDVTFQKGSLTINKKALTVAAENKSKTYGDANPDLTVTYSGLVNGETALNPAPTVTTTASELSGVGTYDITATGTAVNYELTFNKGNLTINKKALTVTAENKSKIYGDANPALTVTYSGLVNSETVLNPAPTVTTTASELSGAGTYDITATGTAANYELTFNKGTLTVGKKALTVTAENKSKTYGDANPALTLTYSGLVNSETALNPAPTVTTTATELSGAGTYDITATGTAANYNLTFNKGTLTVNKKALTVTADNKSKTYGDVNPTLTVSYTGLVNGETVLNPAPSVSTMATTTTGVGSYDITASGAADNYTITFTKGTLTIGKKALTVTADNKSKIYGDVNPALTVSYNGLVNGETALNPAPSISTLATITTGVGTYDITATGNAANYDITFEKGNLIINKKALTITAENKSKIYGDANPTFTIVYSGLTNGETAINPAPTVSTLATAASAAGIYDINASGTAANYDITFEKGILTINKKALTVTAENKSKTYGDANPALTVVYSGLVNGETVLNPAPAVTTVATVATGVGAYDITANGAAANYTVTYVKGTLTIGKKALTITADNKEKFQGLALPTFTASYNGFVNGETNTALTTQPGFSTTANSMSPQGNYPITVSGATAANYTITLVPGILTVKPGYPTSISLAATTVYENAPAGTLAGTLSSTSDDPTTTFTYKLVAGSGSGDNGKFSIVNNEIRTTEPLNFEEKPNYSIRVQSTAQNSLLTLDKEFTVSISNVNEQPTLNDITAQTICYTTDQQVVALNGITAGPDAGQSTNVSVSSSNNNLFKSLTVTQASNGNAQLRYTVAEGTSGSAVVNVMVVDNGGTANAGINTILKSFILNVNALPVITITADKANTISKGDSIELTATGGTKFLWSHANGLDKGYNNAKVFVRPSATTTYRVTVTNDSGCSEMKEFTVNVNEDYITINGTNLITPNGDGINDNFVIKNIDMYPNNEVKIFDRAGRLLYAKKNYGENNDGWTGTLNGAPLAEDTYYYIVDFGPGKPKLKGFITIIRD